MKSTLTSEPATHPEFPPIYFNICRKCSNTQIPLKELGREIENLLEKIDFEARYRKHIGKPIKKHMQFKTALAGCPNGCSQPPIMNIGIVGHCRVAWNQENCDYCGVCQEICQDNAIRVKEHSFELDNRLCLECGRCARNCPQNAISKTSVYYRLLIGGRLGRRPRLAFEQGIFTDREKLLASLEEILTHYLEQAEKSLDFSSWCENSLP